MSAPLKKNFNIGASGEIRVCLFDNAPWFYAEDVCRAMGLEMHTVLSSLDEDEMKLLLAEENHRKFMVVSESGLYSLILFSGKTEARRMRRWLLHDVIPAIRHDGGYLSPDQEDTPKTLIARVVRIARRHGMEASL